MNKLLILPVTIFFLFTSCYHENKPETAKPEHLLSRKEMVQVITDLQIAEGAISYHRMNKTLTDEMSTRYYQMIFDEYHITHRILKDNLRYYNASPEKMEKIMEDVLANLSKLQAEVMAMKDPVNDTLSGEISDTLTSQFTPSLLYQEAWSYTSLIDSLLFAPVDLDAIIQEDSLYGE
jgi:hypothetical protein